MGMKQVSRAESGQMTVELAVAMPVLIVVAVIAFNALQFISQCATFDRFAHDAVRIYAASPAYGQGPEQSCTLVEQCLDGACGSPENTEVSVSHGVTGADFDEYTATLTYHPTLFGMGLRSEVFGVPLPRLVHTTRFVVDTYKPGVIV